MHLWTEYEGNTVAGYLVGHLTRSEGRNAFFATNTPEGERALLRLTEAHFDESELITRWRSIAAVTHPNLQAIKRAGQTRFDGLSLACCLLEPTDLSLADALRDHVFSADETKEVAEAVSGALATLHAAGLVHEHVDASNVFALGETVKLRSDCCRECAGDFEADTPEARKALRQRDVRDLGLLLLRCLGQVWQGQTPAGLPKPLDRIIPGSMSGVLSAQEIVDILRPPQPVPVAPPPTASVVAPAVAHASPAPASPVAVVEKTVPDPQPRVVPTVREARVRNPLLNRIEDVPKPSRQILGTESLDAIWRFVPAKARSISSKVYIAAVTVLAAGIWLAVDHNKPIHEDYAANIDVKSTTSAKAAPVQTSPNPSADSVSSRVPVASTQGGWHVIAYTYSYEQQAEAQVKKLQQKYVSLHPHVFTPTGRAPYFVALGNASDASTAMDIRNRARQVGLPRDTYARNF